MVHQHSTGATYGFRCTLVACLAALCGLGAAYANDLDPTVKIITPEAGGVVGGQEVLVTVEYFSNSGSPIDVVELWVDHRNAHRHPLDQPRLRGRVRYYWDSTQFPPGTHSLEARARDEKGYEGTAVVTVSNVTRGVPIEGVAPYISIFKPSDGARISGRTEVEIDVHPGEARFVYVMLDGKMLAATTESPYILTVDADTLAAGPHTIYAVAKTDQGEIQSGIVTVNVDSASTYVGPELPTPSLAPQTRSVGPELALPSVPEFTVDADEMTGGLVGGGLMLASVDVPRIVSTPTAVATVSTPAPTLVVPAPVAAPLRSVAPAPVPSPIVVSATRPTPVARPVQPGTAPRVVAPAMPDEIAPISARTPSGHGAPSGLPSETVVPKASAPSTDVEAVSVRTVVPTARPMAATRRPTEMTPIAAGPARPMAAAANVAAPKVAVAAAPVVEPTATVEPIARVARATRPQAGSPSYARSGADLTAASLEPVASAAARSAVVGTAPGASTPRAKIAQAASVVGANSAVVRVHVVRAAETLQSVSARYGVSVRRIARANDLDADARISAGSRLNIPPQTTILFDDVPVAFDVEPEIINGVAVAPIRQLLETAGGTVYWMADSQEVRGVVGDTDISVRVGSREAIVDEETVLLDLAAFMKRDRVLVPVRFVGDVLDVTVAYDPETEDVHIVTRDPKPASLDADAA